MKHKTEINETFYLKPFKHNIKNVYDRINMPSQLFPDFKLICSLKHLFLTVTITLRISYLYKYVDLRYGTYLQLLDLIILDSASGEHLCTTQSVAVSSCKTVLYVVQGFLHTHIRFKALKMVFKV